MSFSQLTSLSLAWVALGSSLFGMEVNAPVLHVKTVEELQVALQAMVQQSAEEKKPAASSQPAEEAKPVAPAKAVTPRIVLAPGQYRLSEPLVLTTAHSGTAEHPLVIEAQQPGTVTLSGDLECTGWELWKDGIWRCPLPAEGDFEALYWKGQRQTLARTPNHNPQHRHGGDFFYVTQAQEALDDSREVLCYDPKEVNPAQWGKKQPVGIVVWPFKNTVKNRKTIASFDLAQSTLRLPTVTYPIHYGNRFYLVNDLSFLDQPGEWVIDQASQSVYLIPPDGKSPEGQVSLNFSPGLIHLQGGEESGDPISHIVLRNLTLRQSTKNALRLTNAAHCRIDSCEIREVNDYGILLEESSRRNEITRCHLTQTGRDAIMMEAKGLPLNEASHSLSHNRIVDNHIHHIGFLRNTNGAITITPYCGPNDASCNLIAHNEIHHTPRKGIRFGGHHNIIEYNHIHHANRSQSDSASIGMCTRDILQVGNIIRYNHIHDSGGYDMVEPGVWKFPKYCWDIYLDDFTSNTLVYGNLMEGAERGGVHIHGGQNNVVENNIFYRGKRWQIEFNGFRNKVVDGIEWDMNGNVVRRNIFVTDGPDSGWIAGNHELEGSIIDSDDNLIAPVENSAAILFRRDPPMPFAQWQKWGYDHHSLIADPLFRDAEQGDFRLQPDSPALRQLNFVPLPLERIGRTERWSEEES